MVTDSPARARLEDQIAWYDAKSQATSAGSRGSRSASSSSRRPSRWRPGVARAAVADGRGRRVDRRPGGAPAAPAVPAELDDLSLHLQNGSAREVPLPRSAPGPTPRGRTPRRCWPSASRASSPRSMPRGSSHQRGGWQAGGGGDGNEHSGARPVRVGPSLHQLPAPGDRRLRRTPLRRHLRALRRGATCSWTSTSPRASTSSSGSPRPWPPAAC